MEKISNGIQFSESQVRLKLIYAGKVHRSQGMTLNKAFIDLRSQFGEHGQLYLALSRVRHWENLYILLPESSEETSSSDPTAVSLRIPADREVVNVVSTIDGHPSGEVRPLLSVRSTQPITTESPVDDFTIEPREQIDHETDEASQSPSHGLELLWSDNETDNAHESCMDPTTEFHSPVPIDDSTGGEIASHEIFSDASIEFDAPLHRNEEIDSESQVNNISGTVNLNHLCVTTVALARSILASALPRSHPNHSLISCLHRIRVLIARLLILYRISRAGSGQYHNAK
jgi:hypothetical protein